MINYYWYFILISVVLIIICLLRFNLSENCSVHCCIGTVWSVDVVLWSHHTGINCNLESAIHVSFTSCEELLWTLNFYN